jgi:hypothetical protein
MSFRPTTLLFHNESLYLYIFYTFVCHIYFILGFSNVLVVYSALIIKRI